MEKVQIRATKVSEEIKHFSYVDRVKYLKLPALLHRRLGGDMMMLYEFFSGLYDFACKSGKPSNYDTRGHYVRLFGFNFFCVNILFFFFFL